MKIVFHNLKVLLAWFAVTVLTCCDGGNENSFPGFNLRWKRERPPKRSEYSTITFSREIRGGWVDVLAVSGTHLKITFLDEFEASKNVFILSTQTSRIVLAVKPATESAGGELLKNAGIEILQRKSGIINELLK